MHVDPVYDILRNDLLSTKSEILYMDDKFARKIVNISGRFCAFLCFSRFSQKKLIKTVNKIEADGHPTYKLVI